MEIEWEQAIERQRAALVRIVAMLFAMLGLDGGASVARLPLPLYRAVLRVLYPAESAVRRLIVVVARGLQAKLPERHPLPADLKTKVSAPRKPRRAAFQLCDPRRCLNRENRRPGPKSMPRLHAFRDGELVTILGRSPLEPVAQPETTADATRLCRRLAAIRAALDNLPREAKRLARWRARQANLPPEKIRRPLRPGRPPGHRKQPLYEVDEVLKDCQWLAWEAARVDTS